MRNPTQSRRVELVTMAFLVSLLLFAPAAVSAGQTTEQLAGADISGGSIRFQPLISYSRVQVSVSGPEGFEVVRSFDAGVSAEIQLPGSDGLYKYEIRFALEVSQQDRERLAAARKAGKDDAASGPDLSDRQTVQRGWFSIVDGSLVPDDLVEVSPTGRAADGEAPSQGAAPSRAVLLSISDGVIEDSLCVGGHCAFDPTFSDSTLLLREVNTRIKFADTSIAGGFPNRDWEIQANANSSGGGNYLGFNDCGANDNDGGCGDDLVFAVEGGARRSALYVDDGGNVGFGTSIPLKELHVIGGDSPALRLEQDGSESFTPQTWDVAGNETNFFVRDVTSGDLIPFKIRPGAPTNTLFLEGSTGDIGIGTDAPLQPVHVRRTDASSTNLLIENANGAAQNTQLQMMNGTGNRWDLRNNTAGDFAITLAGSGVHELSIDDATGDLTIAGTLVTGGGGTCDPGPCDGVFRPGGYELESIEEHAAYMWANEHLWGVGPTPEGASINLSKKTTGILHELEKAHIYIEQLHDELALLRDRLTRVEAHLATDQAGSTVE